MNDHGSERSLLAATQTHPAEHARDPRDVFLDAKAVMLRYGWGKTRGYQHLRDRELIPPPVLTHPDRWRLDQLQRWEDHRIAQAESESATLHSSPPGSLNERLPGPKVSRRRSA